MEALPTTTIQLKNASRFDPVLCKVLKHAKK